MLVFHDAGKTLGVKGEVEKYDCLKSNDPFEIMPLEIIKDIQNLKR